MQLVRRCVRLKRGSPAPGLLWMRFPATKPCCGGAVFVSNTLFKSSSCPLFVNTPARSGLSPSLLRDSLLSSHAKKMHSHLFPVCKILCLRETFQYPSAASKRSAVLCQKRGVSDKARCMPRDFDLVVMLRKHYRGFSRESGVLGEHSWDEWPLLVVLRETIRTQKTRFQAFSSGVMSCHLFRGAEATASLGQS